MKYRKKPKDFIVEEIADHQILNKGHYKLYTLEKQGIETLTLLNIISRKHTIPLRDIAIAGIKDTHAQTKQYLTVPRRYTLNSFDNTILKFVGYVNEPLRLGNLRANKFIITVRDIDEDDLSIVLENAKYTENGLPNYYDSQRFGSVVGDEFIGKYLVKKEYEQAVKSHLTSIYTYDSEQLIADKEAILASWPKLKTTIKTHDLKRVLLKYEETNNWLRAFKAISKPLRLLFISAYQSYLWNECIKLLLEKEVSESELYTVPYVLGELVFNKFELANIPQTFQTISHRIKPTNHEEEIIQKVLEDEGVTLNQFNIRQTGNFFKSQNRAVMLYPRDFKISEPIPTGETYKVTVEFTLPKGCYATMVLKSIFGQ